MINALTQSPIVGKKIFEWREKIENQEMLVRDIIDIDSTYEDFEASDSDDLKDNNKDKKENKKDDLPKDAKVKEGEKEEITEEDEFNLSLGRRD